MLTERSGRVHSVLLQHSPPFCDHDHVHVLLLFCGDHVHENDPFDHVHENDPFLPRDDRVHVNDPRYTNSQNKHGPQMMRQRAHSDWHDKDKQQQQQQHVLFHVHDNEHADQDPSWRVLRLPNP